MKKIKILNLYAGIGGNRKLWDEVLKDYDYQITAIELNPEIAAIYKDFFPNDEVIIADAHEYLLRNFQKFDVVWSSHPCQSHSNAKFWASKGGKYDIEYPDLGLYQEIILLQKFFKGKFIEENVNPYYEPLIVPSIKLGRHLFWTNFNVESKEFNHKFKKDSIEDMQEINGLDISNYKINHRKDQILRNCVNPEIGKYLLERALNIKKEEEVPQGKLF